MKYIDNLHNLIFKWYLKKTDIPLVFSVGIISLLVFLHIQLSLKYFLLIFVSYKIIFSKYEIIIAIILILFFFFIRYTVFKKIDENFILKDENFKLNVLPNSKKYYVYCLCFVILYIISPFVLRFLINNNL